MEQEVDLVVAGSGAGGCAAALAGAAFGLRTVLVEKSNRIGGGTASSLGGLWVPANHLMAGAGLSDTLDAARRYLAFLSGGYGLAPMMEAYLSGAPEALRFFADSGITFRLLRGLPDHYFPSAEGASPDGRMVETVRPYRPM